ncbi:group II intron maturase-specific domain-containing protein [Nostoc sp.]
MVLGGVISYFILHLIIRGIANYYRTVVSSQTFSSLDRAC